MIDCVAVNKAYRQGKNINHVLRDIDLHIEDGEMVAILGKSGSGKSTLLNLLGTLDSPDSGEILLDGTSLVGLSEYNKSRIRNGKIGFVMQDYALMNHQTVMQNIMLPLLFSDYSIKAIKGNAKKVAQLVGIENLLTQKAIDISGGERQRTAIARALIIEPKVILADEPTGALDVNTSMDIMRLLKSINSQGTTIVLVTHDLNVAGLCDRIIKIEDGQIK